MTEQKEQIGRKPKSESVKSLEKSNKELYDIQNIVDVTEKEIIYENKTKIIETLTYKCGTKKSRVREVVKRGQKRHTQPRTLKEVKG